MKRRHYVMAAAVSLCALAGGASAVSATSPTVNTSNWYYDDPGMTTTGLTSTSVPTTVPAGDLAVGYRDGAAAPLAGAPVTLPAPEADKLTALRFDLSGVAPGSSVTDFSFTVTVDTTNDPGSAVAMANPPALVACLSLRMFASGPGPSPYDQAPAYDCSSKAAGVVDTSTDTYTFHAAVLANAWVGDVNTGLVILPDPAAANPTTFTLSLEPASRITSAVTTAPGTPSTTPAGASTTTSSVTAPVTVPVSPATATGQQTSPSHPVTAAPKPAGPVARANGGTAGQPDGTVVAAPPAANVPPVTVAGENAVPPPSVAADTSSSPPAAVSGQGGDPQALSRAAAATALPTVSRGGPGALGWAALVLGLLLVFGLASLGLSTSPGRVSGKASRLTSLLARLPK